MILIQYLGLKVYKLTEELTEFGKHSYWSGVKG